MNPLILALPLLGIYLGQERVRVLPPPALLDPPTSCPSWTSLKDDHLLAIPPVRVHKGAVRARVDNRVRIVGSRVWTHDRRSRQIRAKVHSTPPQIQASSAVDPCPPTPAPWDRPRAQESCRRPFQIRGAQTLRSKSLPELWAL